MSIKKTTIANIIIIIIIIISTIVFMVVGICFFSSLQKRNSTYVITVYDIVLESFDIELARTKSLRLHT